MDKQDSPIGPEVSESSLELAKPVGNATWDFTRYAARAGYRTVASPFRISTHEARGRLIYTRDESIWKDAQAEGRSERSRGEERLQSPKYAGIVIGIAAGVAVGGLACLGVMHECINHENYLPAITAAASFAATNIADSRHIEKRYNSPF